MPYELTIQEKAGYLHARVTGDNCGETVLGYLGEVAASCARHGCPNVVIEENLQGPGLSTLDIFNVASETSKHVWPVVRLIAYADINPQHQISSMQFAETVAVNRGVNVRVFATIKEAEEWLVGEIGRVSPRSEG